MGTPSPRLKEIGPWSEQFSSSGKRYYYNRETEVSQWEKPTEWKQAEKDHVEQRVRSSTVGTREDKNASSCTKLRHRPSVSSTSVAAAHSSSVSSKPVDSSTGNAVRSSASPSVTSTAPQSNGLAFGGKTTEWKQAEKDHVEQRVRSSTVDTSTREDKNVSSCTKLRHRPSVSSTSVAAHSPSVSSKPVDSSTGNAVRSSASSPSVLNTSTAPQSNAFHDDMYTKFYCPEEVAVGERRLLNCEEFVVNMRRCVDRKAKHANIVFSIDRDLHSVQTLSRMAEFRSQLLKQRIAATSKRILELESKSQ